MEETTTVFGGLGSFFHCITLSGLSFAKEMRMVSYPHRFTGLCLLIAGNKSEHRCDQSISLSTFFKKKKFFCLFSVKLICPQKDFLWDI